MFSTTLWSLTFLIHDEYYASSGVNITIWCAIECDVRTLLEDTHNLIWGPHSVPTYTPYTTELVVAGSKAYCNDQLWKTLVESHLVSFFFHKYIHTYRLYYKSCVRCHHSSCPMVGSDHVPEFSRIGGTQWFRGGVVSRKFTVNVACCAAGPTARSTNRARSARGDFTRHWCAV